MAAPGGARVRPRPSISGRSAPAALDPAPFPSPGRTKQDLFAWPEVEGDRNIHGPLSFVIPSAVAGYALLHERHGRLPLRDVLAPAIALARRGLPQDWYTTLKVANAAAVLRLYAESARIYLPNGLPPVAPYQGTPGFFALGNLPATLERLADAGLRDFYEGEVAASVAQDVREMGGVLSAADLAGLPRPRAAGGGRALGGAAPPARQRLDRGADPPAGAGGHGGRGVRRRRPVPGLVRALRPRPCAAPMPSAWPGSATRSRARRRAAPPTSPPATATG